MHYLGLSNPIETPSSGINNNASTFVNLGNGNNPNASISIDLGSGNNFGVSTFTDL
jgi:hypothetical protein